MIIYQLLDHIIYVKRLRCLWFMAFGFRYFRYLVLFSFLVSAFEGTLYEKENDDIESISEKHNEMAAIKLRSAM